MWIPKIRIIPNTGYEYFQYYLDQDGFLNYNEKGPAHILFLSATKNSFKGYANPPTLPCAIINTKIQDILIIVVDEGRLLKYFNPLQTLCSLPNCHNLDRKHHDTFEIVNEFATTIPVFIPSDGMECRYQPKSFIFELPNQAILSNLDTLGLELDFFN